MVIDAPNEYASGEIRGSHVPSHGHLTNGPSLLFERLQADLSNKIGHFPAHLCIFWGHVFEVLAAGVQETGNSEARAIELTNDMVTLMAVNRDEIGSPEEWKGTLGELERVQVISHLFLHLLLELLVICRES